MSLAIIFVIRLKKTFEGTIYTVSNCSYKIFLTLAILANIFAACGAFMIFLHNFNENNMFFVHFNK